MPAPQLSLHRYGAPPVAMHRAAPHGRSALAHRLATLCPGPDGERLAACIGPPRTYSAHAQVQADGEGHPGVRAVLAGWAGLCRIFADGRRQIQHLIGPGELLIAPAGHRTVGSITALTTLTIAPADRLAQSAAGQEALERAGDLVEQQLLNQVARMGRQLAYERVAHLLLELHDRAMAAGQATAMSFPMPLTQEILADTLGLTSVHMNRTLQMLRREGLIELRGGVVRLIDAMSLARLGEYQRPVPLF